MPYDDVKNVGDRIVHRLAGHGVTSAYVGGRTLVEPTFDEKETERTTLPWVGYRARKWEPETHPLAGRSRHVPALRHG
jgi:hypothetical protein